MNKATVIVLVAAILALTAVSATMATDRTPAGSFLKYRAASVSDLSSQVAKDTAARIRYAQHFGVSPDEVGDFFAHDLKLVTLKSPLKVRTWYVGTNDRIYRKTKILPKGTLVFATKDGKPMLAWSCGNPLSANLPLAKPVAVAAAPETKVLANPVETVTAAAVTAPPAPATVADVPVAAPPPMAAYSQPPVAVPPPLGGKFFFPLFWWPSHHHHKPPPPPPPPVPEPSSLMAMGMGLSAVALGIRRRRAHS